MKLSKYKAKIERDAEKRTASLNEPVRSLAKSYMIEGANSLFELVMRLAEAFNAHLNGEEYVGPVQFEKFCKELGLGGE